MGDGISWRRERGKQDKDLEAVKMFSCVFWMKERGELQTKEKCGRRTIAGGFEEKKYLWGRVKASDELIWNAKAERDLWR